MSRVEWGNGFREFLRGLPDAIERARDNGQPIVVALPPRPPEHISRLMDTLGVDVVEDPMLPRPRSWEIAERGERDTDPQRLRRAA